MCSCVQSWNCFKSVFITLFNLFCFMHAHRDMVTSAVCGAATKSTIEENNANPSVIASHGSHCLGVGMPGHHAF